MPINDRLIGGPHSALGGERTSDSGGAGGVSGSPRQTDPNEKHFERSGFEIVEVAASEIADLSNDRKEVAFCIVDDDEVRGGWKMSDPNAVFARSSDDMELSLGDHFAGAGRLLQTEDEAEGVELRGFGIDAREDGKGVNFSFNRGGRMRDVTVRGEGDATTDWGCGIYCKIPRGQKVVLENVNQPGGASRNTATDSTHDSIGAFLNAKSNGVLELHHCEFGGFPNNGLYGEPWKKNHDGYVKVYDHVGYNSDRDQLRVGGPSIIENPTLYVDESKPGFDNHRGIWFKAANGARVTGGSIKTFPGSDSGSAIRVQSSSAAVEIEDIDIELRGTDYRARGVLAFSPDDRARRTGDVSVTVRDSRIHGDAPTRDGVLIKNRPGSKVVDTEIDLPNVDESNYVDIR
ncbi:hypothetical protein [Halococcus saccharolyticus]|uniref:Right handed beta helix domain-containing protein n=1 Tax=Halococcus saccharolyticus DSM 5350 TaxID=1227455 RepID=M0MQS6_9EURY|nr:hypothetical protein [Halococcus saccharolyticus]EMA47976.1 hypothetical protein C449_00850 [Halococcus saccharolyticus DSM 5350]